ncbi:MAG: RNA methyltransferase [Acidimicrobiia bacterium]|nr:RNA methyltransferase [Acidimicrobiia bacterium]
MVERAEAAGADRYVLTRQPLERLSRRQTPPQVIAVAVQPAWTVDELAADRPSLVLIADAVEKPGNLGAMMRSADAAGADAFIVSDPVTDLANPNVIRASQGALFSFPVAAAPAEAVAAWLDRHQLNVLIAADDATTRLWDIDLKQPTAIVIGSEDRGPSDTWREHQQVSIPMAGASDSLNASVAAAVFLFEAARQRSH